MGCPVDQRTYKKNIESERARGNMTDAQVRSTKNARCKARSEARRQERETFMSERRASSPAEQLKHLDWRLGKGVGAKRERTRLLALIERGI